MKKLYDEALATTNTKDELKIKLKKNDKATLTKYINKLEMKGISSDATQEQILDAICEFLITPEGKYRAVFNLSETTYQQMYKKRYADPAVQNNSSSSLPV
jgi:hypothetical protein